MDLERSRSPLSKDVLDVVLLILKQKLLGFKKVVLRLDFDVHFSSFTLSGVSVNTVHYAGSNRCPEEFCLFFVKEETLQEKEVIIQART
jgi:hypothetical protein